MLHFNYATLDEVRQMIDPDKPLAWDTETKGKYGPIQLVQFYQEHWDEALLVLDPDPFTLAMMLDKQHIIAHNIHYDISTIQRQTSTKWVPKNYDCTFLLARLYFFKEERFSLDKVMTYVYGDDPYAAVHIDKKVMQKSDYSKRPLTDAQLRYAATDVFYLPGVYHRIKQSRAEFSYKLDKCFLNKCLDFQNNGMHVDNGLLLAHYQGNMDRLKEIDLPINANSYVQVRAYLNTTQSDDKGLAKLAAQGDTKAADVRETRGILKQNSFLDKFDTQDGRIFGTFKPSARSGRATSDDQNLQQIPRKLKGVFTAPPGRKLVYADYAQLELRTICSITQCSLMEKLFRDGVDLHSYTAEFIFGKDWTPEHRQVAKTCNFNFLYGGGIPVFLEILLKNTGIVLDEQKAYDIRNKWRKLWKEIFGWQQRGIGMWRKGVPGSTPLGRKYKAKMMTDQLNIENQGAGAEVAKLATHYLDLSEFNNAFVVNFVHDSFIIECDDDPAEYELVSQKLAKAMQEAWFELSKCLPTKDLPMPVQVCVGDNWKTIEDVYDYKLDIDGMKYYNANV